MFKWFRQLDRSIPKRYYNVAFNYDATYTGGIKMEKYVKINVKELKDLLEAEARLAALECSGVSNWDWYGEAFSNYLEFDGKYDDWDDFIKSETDEERLIEKYGEVK